LNACSLYLVIEKNGKGIRKSREKEKEKAAHSAH
jgi:hypothetical protein